MKAAMYRHWLDKKPTPLQIEDAAPTLRRFRAKYGHPNRILRHEAWTLYQWLVGFDLISVTITKA